MTVHAIFDPLGAGFIITRGQIIRRLFFAYALMGGGGAKSPVDTFYVHVHVNHLIILPVPSVRLRRREDVTLSSSMIDGMMNTVIVAGCTNLVLFYSPNQYVLNAF
jgi:hypothetical protein